MSSRPTIWLISFVTEEFLLPGNVPPHPPMSGLYLAASLRKAGWTPKILHLLPSHVGDLTRWMASEKPDMAGFTVLTGPTLPAAIEASARARQMGLPVVWGGVHASMLPEDCARQTADYVVSGEGEETIAELVEAITEGGDVANIAGVAHMVGDEISVGPPRPPVRNLDDYPPAWDLIDPQNYVNRHKFGGTLVYMFSRGCPYRCRFCYNEPIRAGKWRRHSDEYFAETIAYLSKRAKFSAIDFNDDFLFESPGKSTGWVEELARRGVKWTASFRSRSITPETARWLEEHGCVEVRIGMESGHQATLDMLSKKLTVDDHYNAARALAQTSIMGTVGFVINWPGETRESIVATLRLTDELARINPRIRFNLGYYIPMPGTPIYEEAIAEGFAAPQKVEQWGAIFEHPYRYRGFSKREIEAMEVISGRLYRHYLEPWPFQGLMEPAMRWRWRNGRFKWFAIGAARRWIKSLTGLSATQTAAPDAD